jgi:hypothetical protein
MDTNCLTAAPLAISGNVSVAFMFTNLKWSFFRPALLETFV